MQHPPFMDGLCATGYFQTVDSQALSFVGAGMQTVSLQEIYDAVGKSGRADLTAVFDKRKVQITHVVIYGTSAGVTARQFDLLLSGIFKICFRPYILIFTDNDGRFILP